MTTKDINKPITDYFKPLKEGAPKEGGVTNITMSIKRILQSGYYVIGTNIYEKYNKTEQWQMKNALRELNQKTIMNDSETKKLKNKANGVCPFCNVVARRLTCAHVGTPVAKIIDEIMGEHYPQKSLNELFEILQTRQKKTIIVICCDICNKECENIENP